MKKALLLILLSISIFSCKTQKEVDFNASYSPNSQYDKTLKKITESSLKYIASDEILDRLKKRGIENPKISKDSSLLKYKTNTGTLKGDKFTIVMELLESVDPLMSSDTKFYGKSVDGQMQIDSISSSAFTEQEKIALFPIIESMIDKVNYPNRKFKVGESFEQKDPLSVPLLTGEPIDVMIHSIYTLKKVKKGIGYFDLEQSYTLKSPMEDYEVEIEGIGKGQVKYDIKNQSVIKYYSEMLTLSKADLEDFSIEMQTKVITDQTTELSKKP